MRLARALLALTTLTGSHTVSAATPVDLEIAFIANAEGGTVTLLDVAARKVIATLDTNPDKTVVQRPGTPNYAQDTDVAPDGRTLYVSRGYLGDVAAFDIATGRQSAGQGAAAHRLAGRERHHRGRL